MVVAALSSPNIAYIGSRSAWILDLGATDRVTFDSQPSLTFTSSCRIPFNTVVDGSHTQVDGCEDIDL